MASPGFTRHLNDLLGHVSRLTALMRSPATAPKHRPRAGSVDVHAFCPQKTLRRVVSGLADEALFHRVDIMRRYRWDVPLLCVDEILLASVLTDLVRAAIIASGRHGAVICDLHYDEQGLRFSISDSSGVTGQDVRWWQGCNRFRLLGHLEQDVIRLGGRQLMSVFEGEGVVVELLFASALCRGPAHRSGHARAVNEPHLPPLSPKQDRYHPRRP